jgi:hypothetical protein
VMGKPIEERGRHLGVIDYAHSMATWSFSDLENAIRSAATVDGRKPPQSLFQLVEEEGELDEIAFTDAVSRNLRLGRMLLLIIGETAFGRASRPCQIISRRMRASISRLGSSRCRSTAFRNKGSWFNHVFWRRL